MKKILTSALALGLLVSPSLVFSAYDDVTLSTDTVLTVGGVDLNVAGSTASLESIEMTNDGNSFTVVLSENSTIKITSADRKVLTTNAPAKYIITNTCDSSVSTLELASYSALVTILITPEATTCTLTASPSTSGTGRGSGGGGGGGAVIKRTVSTPAAIAQTGVSQPSTAPSVSSITRTLGRGQTGNDVTTLQTLLSMDPSIYPEQSVTGYFGPATERAVKAFQAKYGIDTLGIVGPATRAMLSEVFGSMSGTPATSPAPATSAVAPVTSQALSRSLKPGSVGSDVKVLQQFLNSQGFTVSESGPGSVGNETTLMGSLTVEALKKFQTKYDIVTEGTPETTGFGNLGPKTRAKINELMGL